MYNAVYMNKKSKYFYIANALKDKILNGIYPPGSRLPGHVALAKEYGVSVITSNRALNELRKLGLIERGERKGSFVLEKPEFPKEIIIAHFNLPEKSSFMIEEYWKGICSRASELNIPWKMELIAPAFYDKINNNEFQSKGIIILGNEIEDCIRALEKKNVTCVLTGKEAQICKLCVTENRKKAASELTKKMIDSGCKKIAFLGRMTSDNHKLAMESCLETIKSANGNGFIVDMKNENTFMKIKNLIKNNKSLDGIILIGADLCMKSLPVLLRSEQKIKIGMFTENSYIEQFKDAVYLASYSQHEVGRLSVDLLRNAMEGRINCKTIQYAPYKISSPSMPL